MQMKAIPWAIVTGAMTASLACSGGGGGGGPMGTPIGDIRGQYSITHQGSIAGQGALSCPGVLNITVHEGTSFSGTITIENSEACQNVEDQGTISGTVTSIGTLTFTIVLPFIDVLLEAAQCDIIGGSPTFTGSATTSGISATRTNRLRCEVEPGQFLELDFAYLISGTKS